MKSSKYNDFKRDCLKKWDKGDYHLKSINIENIFNWKDATVTFHHPVTLITGKNGVGKTTVINAVKHAVKHQNSESPEIGFFSIIDYFFIQLENFKSKCIEIDNKGIQTDEFKLPTVIDLTFNSSLYSFFNEYTSEQMLNYQKTLEQFDAITLPGNLLALMKEILEKPIQSAEKIIDEDQQDKEYYKITINDEFCYDSYTMGSGEFFINQFLWGLNDIPPCSIVIIEELENYLHSGAQKKILELIHFNDSFPNIDRPCGKRINNIIEIIKF